MKTLEKDFKGTQGDFEIRYPEGFNYVIVSGNQTVASVDGQYGDLATCEENEEKHLADVKLLANSKKVLEAAIELLALVRNDQRPISPAQEYAEIKLEQAISDSL
jgi:hypothetical protein